LYPFHIPPQTIGESIHVQIVTSVDFTSCAFMEH